MKKLIFLLCAAMGIGLAACEQDPDMDKLSGDYVVFTARDTTASFSSYSTFYVADSILLIDHSETPEYWSGTTANTLIQAFVTQMSAAGFTQVIDKSEATLGLQLSYVKSTYYLTAYGSNPWWNSYPGYWYPGYWGGYWGGGWSYPNLFYSYSTGSLLADLVALESTQGAEATLPVVWNAYIGGLLGGSGTLNTTLAVTAIKQAFAQSSYLKQ
jgi:hypothetical protein